MEMAEDKRAMVITNLDYPDPDVIRVDDTYYMVSTTMYFMPGCEILKSKDLINWEHAAFVYDYLDGTDGHKLKGDKNIYGKGMWAASLTYNKGTYYVVFAAVFIACIGGNDIVTVVWSFAQAVKIACSDYITLMSVHP